MARAYRMTSARRAAIKKAQAASARKRKGRHRRRAAIGIAVGVGIGVLGVTLTRNPKKRKAAGPVNVVNTTLPQAPAVTKTKEIDILRVTLDSPGVIHSGGVDFSVLGKPEGSQLKTRKLSKKQNKADLAAKGKAGKGKIRVGAGGRAVKVKRDRQGFNQDRKNDYVPSSRSKRYQDEKARGTSKWLTAEHRAMKREQKKRKNG